MDLVASAIPVLHVGCGFVFHRECWARFWFRFLLIDVVVLLDPIVNLWPYVALFFLVMILIHTVLAWFSQLISLSITSITFTLQHLSIYCSSHSRIQKDNLCST